MPQAEYTTGSLSVVRKDDETFQLTGRIGGNADRTDHFQLICEALSIAANSSDVYRADFQAMLDEIENMTVDW